MYGIDFGTQLGTLGIAQHISTEALMRGLQAGLMGQKITTGEDVRRSQLFLHKWKNGAEADTESVPSIDEGSFIYGVNFGEYLRRAGIDSSIVATSVEQGLSGGLAGSNKLSPQDTQRLKLFAKSEVEAAAAANEKASRDFLARNRHQKGVKTTASGLQFKILSNGDARAATPKPGDQVTVNYRGVLLDGTQFDSSYDRHRAATFRTDAVIKGWQEALLMMKPGARWQLFVSPELAYGRAPRPGIPAGSILIFDVTLLADTSPAAEPPIAETHGN